MPVQHMTRDDVDQICRKKRRSRISNACYPCRQRKVRCNSTRPCRNCVERDHEDICSFEDHVTQKNRDSGINLPSKRRRTGTREQSLNPEKNIPGHLEDPRAGCEGPIFGSNSVPSFVCNNFDQQTDDVYAERGLQRDILPMLGFQVDRGQSVGSSASTDYLETGLAKSLPKLHDITL